MVKLTSQLPDCSPALVTVVEMVTVPLTTGADGETVTLESVNSAGVPGPHAATKLTASSKTSITPKNFFISAPPFYFYPSLYSFYNI
jgi:hypothetical protein